MSTQVELVGGLGNQFFGYFAGMAHAITFGKEVNFNLKNVNESLHTFETIDSISLPGNFCWSKSPSKVSLKLHPHRYESNQLGFDEKILTNGNLKIFKGYFQSFRYLEIFKCRFPNWRPYLNTESQFYRETAARIEESKPISIHLRRGDYKKLRHTFGLLNTNYYIECLRLATEKFGRRKIYIFGDEYPANISLSGELRNLGYDSEVINPRFESPAMESLLLMSACPINIIGNSTFGWWAAAFNSSPLAIYAPSKWFKSINDPVGLIPPPWITVQSSWE